MSEVITVGLFSLAGTLIGSIGGIVAANRLTNYRISELERKVEKHIPIAERTTILERDLQSAWRSIDELKEKEQWASASAAIHRNHPWIQAREGR